MTQTSLFELGKTTDETFDDLLAFGRLEVDSGDLEPWAEIIKAVSADQGLSDEQTLWLIKLYNAYDSFGSAWQVFRRWNGPHEWAAATDRTDAAKYECTRERRNLRGGLVNKHLMAYADHLGAESQRQWLTTPEQNFLALMKWVRQVWGVGRQTGFEWVEFLGKAGGFPVVAPDAQLWESEGPRRSLQALFENPTPTPAQLESYAVKVREILAARGLVLSWEDLETVICDFHVMQNGRYYPGRHLAALRGEIDEIGGADQEMLLRVFRRIIPGAWGFIGPGIDKRLLPVYRDTGRIVNLGETLKEA